MKNDASFERLSVDIREKNVEIPLLLQAEYALEGQRPARPKGAPPRSNRRLDVYRAARAFGEVFENPMKELAHAAGCSVRECQKAVRDMEWLGWFEKVVDVANRGGAAYTPEGKMKRKGNAYKITRPEWAWNGQHHKHLGCLAVGVHTVHPYLQEFVHPCTPEKPLASKAADSAKTGRGAHSAGVRGVHSGKAPLSHMALKKPNKREATPRERLEWPAEADSFLQPWVDRYKHRPFPDKDNLAVYAKVLAGAGSAGKAALISKAYLASNEPYYVSRRHVMAVLGKQWEAHIPLDDAKTGPKRPLIAKGSTLLERHHANGN